jgi:hypothetical protein
VATCSVDGDDCRPVSQNEPSGPEPPQWAAVLAAIKERPGSGEQASLLACRPSIDGCYARRLKMLAVGAKVSLRRGRTKVRIGGPQRGAGLAGASVVAKRRAPRNQCSRH